MRDVTVPPLKLVGAILMATTLLTGCGEHGGGGGSASPIIPIVESPNAPAEYQLEDAGCQKAATPTALNHITIRAWDEQKVVEKQVDASALGLSSTDDSLVSPIISLTSWKEVYDRVCDLKKPKGHECDDQDGFPQGWGLQHTSGHLKICQDGHAYGRQTYEGVALTSAYYLSLAQQRYLNLAPTATPPKAVKLSVLPHFVDYYDHYVEKGSYKRLKTYATHNLAYFPVGQMIAVFPDTANQAATQTGFFWESQFVLGHEFGHHIDFTRHGKVLANAGLDWDPLGHEFADRVAVDQGLSAGSDRARVQGALSEAFADLLSYYAEGGTGASLVGLPDLGINRNISGAKFMNGDAKILTEDRIGMLFGLVDPGAPDAGKPSYTDIHIIGAIFSHSADELFSALTKTNPQFTPGGAADIDQRYRMTLAWMDALVEGTAQLTASQEGSEVLQPVARAFEKVADSFLGAFPLTGDDGLTDAKLKNEYCHLALEMMPTLPSPPYGIADGRCE